MGYNFNNPPSGTGGPVIRWLVGAVQFLSRQLNGIAANGGGGGTGSRYLKTQAFTPTLTAIYYVTPATQPFTVGALLTGDVTGATGNIDSIDDRGGIIYLTSVTGTFDGTDLSYSDDAGGLADSTGQRGNILGDVVIANDTDVLFYDPTTAIPAATIYVPDAPQDGQVTYVYFGGTNNKEGNVVVSSCNFRVQGHLADTFIANNHLVKAQVGTPTKLVYRAERKMWYIT